MAFLTKSPDSKSKSSLNNRQRNKLSSLPLQAKLRMGKPHDAYEQEANRVADRVMGMSEAQVQRQTEEEEVQTLLLVSQITPLVQRQPEEEETAQTLQRQEEEEEETAQPLQRQEEEEEETAQTLQRQEEEEEETAQAKTFSGQTPRISANLESRIQSQREGGQPLPESARNFFEPRFGTDFSGVRVHTDAEANSLSREINARAFTVGRDIFVGSGQYNPYSSAGRHLLAHELTHTVQQGAVVRRQPVAISQHTSSPMVQGDWFGIRNKVEKYADKIPGYFLFKVILGKSPITKKEVPPTGINILRGVLTLIPVLGEQWFKQLKKTEAADKAGAWLDKEIKIIKNFLSAFAQGFSQFSKNILKHLKGGIFGWLLGSLSSAGVDIQIPKKFDLKSIFGLVTQVLGFTYETIKLKLTKKLGSKANKLIELLEKYVGFVKELVTKGSIALWEKVKQSLGNLKQMVFDKVKQWVALQVIGKAITKLLLMMNPAGALLAVAEGIYKVVMFFIDRWDQIKSLVVSLFGSIRDIAFGNLKKAIAYVEKVLATGLTLVISFMARYVGLGGIGKEIQKILKAIRKPIDKAVNRVIGWLVKKTKVLLKRNKNKKKKQYLEQSAKAIRPELEKLLKKGASKQLIAGKFKTLKQSYKLSVLTIGKDGKVFARGSGKIGITQTDELTSKEIGHFLDDVLQRASKEYFEEVEKSLSKKEIEEIYALANSIQYSKEKVFKKTLTRRQQKWLFSKEAPAILEHKIHTPIRFERDGYIVRNKFPASWFVRTGRGLSGGGGAYSAFEDTLNHIVEYLSLNRMEVSKKLAKLLSAPEHESLYEYLNDLKEKYIQKYSKTEHYKKLSKREQGKEKTRITEEQKKLKAFALLVRVLEPYRMAGTDVAFALALHFISKGEADISAILQQRKWGVMAFSGSEKVAKKERSPERDMWREAVGSIFKRLLRTVKQSGSDLLVLESGYNLSKLRQAVENFFKKTPSQDLKLALEKAREKEEKDKLNAITKELLKEEKELVNQFKKLLKSYYGEK